MMVKKLNWRALREEGKVPRVHGNGFLQLDYGDLSRVHIWGHPKLPSQSVRTAIHNHRFGFVSEIVVGRLINIRYDIRRSSQPTHDVYVPKPRDGEDTVLVRDGNIGSVSLVKGEVLALDAGESYSMKPAEYHDTFSVGIAATFMSKVSSLDMVPRVLVPLGEKPDNSFNRNAFDPDFLWKIVEEVLG